MAVTVVTDFPYPLRRGLRGFNVFLFAVLAAFTLNGTAQTPAYDRSGPWWKVVPRPLLSVAYTPEPSDYAAVCHNPAECKYFDSDFYNSDFKLLWGPSGRDDLRTLGEIHANNLQDA